MNIQIFGARKSFDTKKAERWFKERRIKYQYIDLDSKGLSPGEYRSIRAAVGYDALVDREAHGKKPFDDENEPPKPPKKTQR